MKTSAKILVCLALLFAANPARAQQPPPALAGIEVQEHLGAQLPLDRSFTTTRGERIRLGDVLGNGKPTLLVLAYSRCTMLCNLVLRGAAGVVHELTLRPGRDFNAVAISIDPREAPGEASRTQQMLLVKAGYAGQTERWPFLVGTKADIDAVASTLGFRYRWDAPTEQYAHPAVMFVLSSEGRVAGYFYGLQHDTRAIDNALRCVGPASHAKAAVASVLSCFRFDTLSQKYGKSIRFCFQAGAAAVLMLLVAGIVRLRARPSGGP
jgi:protein SCO1/2